MSGEHLQRAERVSMSADVKGDAYEGLLEAAPFHPWNRGIRTSLFSNHAQDTKSGAGQYSARASCFALPPPSMESFTPRPLMDSAHPGASAFGRATRAQFRSRRNCQAIVDVMAPKLDVYGCTNTQNTHDAHGVDSAARGRTPKAAGETVSDPACGTGGFLLAAHDCVVTRNPQLTMKRWTTPRA